MHSVAIFSLQALKLSEEDHAKLFRRLAYLEKLAKLTQQLQQKREVILIPYLGYITMICTCASRQERVELDAMLKDDSSLAEVIAQEKQQCDRELRDIEVIFCVMYSTIMLLLLWVCRPP